MKEVIDGFQRTEFRTKDRCMAEQTIEKYEKRGEVVDVDFSAGITMSISRSRSRSRITDEMG